MLQVGASVLHSCGPFVGS